MFFVLACAAKEDACFFLALVLFVHLVKLMATLFDVASFASIRLQVFRRETMVNTASTYEGRRFSFSFAVLDIIFRPALLVVFPAHHEDGTHPTYTARIPQD